MNDGEKSWDIPDLCLGTISEQITPESMILEPSSMKIRILRPNLSEKIFCLWNFPLSFIEIFQRETKTKYFIDKC